MFDENTDILHAPIPNELSEEQLETISGGVVISIIGILVG
jgi:bacteriocin-like protein